MSIYIRLIIYLLTISSISFTQINNVYAEIGNPPIFPTINYERNISIENQIFYRIGYSKNYFFSETNLLLFGVSKAVGNDNLKFEIGGGICNFFWKGGSRALLFPNVGFRYYNYDQGSMMKIGFCPLILENGESEFMSFSLPYLALGFLF